MNHLQGMGPVCKESGSVPYKHERKATSLSSRGLVFQNKSRGWALNGEPGAVYLVSLIFIPRPRTEHAGGGYRVVDHGDRGGFLTPPPRQTPHALPRLLPSSGLACAGR